MTTSTILSTSSVNQNAAGQPFVPANTVVNSGAPVNRRIYTLTVSPTTGWAKVAYREGSDGVNYPGSGEVFCAPNSGGTALDQNGAPLDPPMQYFTATVLEISPGATCTFTVTY